MSGRPRLLDLFCGAGGAAVGYSRAGFDVVGVDIAPQPRYPFEFIQANALEVLACLNDPDASEHYDDWLPATKLIYPFDAIHASPPCQAYSIGARSAGTAHRYPDLIGPVRELLEATGLPYVIENVPGAPLRSPVVICGLSVGVNVKRHRLFESNVPLMVPPCGAHDGDWLGVYGHATRNRSSWGRVNVGVAAGREAMGIDWMTREELNEAIPPAYTELVGAQLLAHVRREAA